MAKIHAGKTRFSNRSLIDALNMSKPGDELIVHEGEHRFEFVRLSGVHITGVGDLDKIVVHGRLDVWGECRIANVTLRAPHFQNSVYLREPRSRVDLTGVAVHADPARKYPAIFGKGGTVVMDNSTVHSAAADPSIALTAPGYVHAVKSGLAGMKLEGGRAVLVDVRVSQILCSKGAKVEAYGRLDITPTDGRRCLVLSGESVCTAPAVRLANTPCEALCKDSFLQLDSVEVPDGATLLVIKEGHAVVESTSDAVTVHDPKTEAQAAAQEPAPGPKVVHWRLADARSFRTAVAPHVNVGDTVQLEEGEYFLEDYANNALGIAVNVVGTGAADSAVIHGTLYTLGDCDVSVSNLTLRPPVDSSGVRNQSGASLSMTNVIVEPSAGDFPAVYMDSGATSMDGCVVAAPTDCQTGVMTVNDGARLEARESSVGWLFVNNASTAELSNCASLQIQTQEGSTVTSRGSHLVEANACGQRELLVEGGSAVSLEALTTNAPDFQASVVASTLDIGWLETPEDGTARILLQGAAHAQVGGTAVTVEDLDADAQTAESHASPAEPSDGEYPYETDNGRYPSSLPTVDSSWEAPPDEPTMAPEAPGGEADGNDGTIDPLAEIEALTGLTTVKQQVRKFTRMVQYNQLRAQQGKPSTNMVMHSLFLGNPGTGKTMVARLLGQALFRAGAIPSETFVEVPGRAALVGDTIGSSAKLTTAVLERARGGVLFIDEAYSLYKPNNNEFAQEAVDTILTFMENHRDEIVVIFAGYGEQMQDLLGMNPGLKSRVKNRFDFEDYGPAEVAEIGYQELIGGDHTVNEELYRRVAANEYRRSSDQGNGRWARNFNEDLVAVLAERVLDAAPGEVDISHIADEDLHTLVGGNSEDKDEHVQQLLAELDAMIGLAPVKEWVRRLVNRVKVDQKRMERDGTVSRPTYHMVFAGNRGTGKTTVARIIAELFHNLGILQNSTVKEVNRSKLIGQFIGETEKITTKAVDEAMGGVLFVDEAYQLYIEDSPRDFGRQAMETLITRLEDDREKFVGIFAGYSQDMDRFLDANQGLRSRIPERIEFPDYTPEEVGQIVVARLPRSWTFDEEHVAGVATAAYAAAAPEDRSNGRWARIFIERLEAELSDYQTTHDIDGDELDHIPSEVVDAVASASRV